MMVQSQESSERVVRFPICIRGRGNEYGRIQFELWSPQRIDAGSEYKCIWMVGTSVFVNGIRTQVVTYNRYKYISFQFRYNPINSCVSNFPAWNESLWFSLHMRNWLWMTCSTLLSNIITTVTSMINNEIVSFWSAVFP